MNHPVVVIPTYDEAAALPSLLDRILALPEPCDVLVVDDASPDGTGELADAYEQRTGGRVRVLHRKGKLGLGSAYRDGFKQAMANGASIIIEMDADHSHNPEIPRPPGGGGGEQRRPGDREPLRQRGRVENWPFRRLLLSRFANYYVNAAAGSLGARQRRHVRLPRLPARGPGAHRTGGGDLERVLLPDRDGVSCVAPGVQVGRVPITFRALPDVVQDLRGDREAGGARRCCASPRGRRP
jgi:glycosyltransferase involved in cell wall biosynthesis